MSLGGRGFSGATPVTAPAAGCEGEVLTVGQVDLGLGSCRHEYVDLGRPVAALLPGDLDPAVVGVEDGLG